MNKTTSALTPSSMTPLLALLLLGLLSTEFPDNYHPLTCRVYDRYHIKRCNNCQHFGHYAKECPTPDSPTCSERSEEHLTENCRLFDQKCINCIRNKEDDVGHTATSFKCPSFIQQQNVLKNKSNGDHLNMRPSDIILHW